MKHIARYSVIVCILIGMTSFMLNARQSTQSIKSRPVPSTHTSNETANRSRYQSRPIWGQHIILGYYELEDIVPYIQAGMIGGIFLNRINIEGKSIASLSAEISTLQQIAYKAGHPPLLIAADQEGGVVEKLSPPLKSHPSLASVIDDSGDDWQQAVGLYAESQATDLSKVGVNLNLAPVVDIDPNLPKHRNDEARLDDRTISTSSAMVASVAQIYAQKMLEQNIIPTFKHFPGLGAVIPDTHQGPVTLDSSYEEMWSVHMLPYRVALNPPTAIMLSHITWIPIDPNHAVSHSNIIIQNYIRNALQFEGLVVTDDLTMKAITASETGLEKTAIESLNAGADLLLIAGRPELFTSISQAFDQAVANGSLNQARLQESRARLDLARDWL